MKILLVDDKPQNLVALEAVLEELGQDLVKANSGPEALRHVLSDEFAAILLDVRMPGMDGFETATLIRQRDKSRHTPIIFLTAYKDDELQFQGYSTGAVDYLVKPLEPEVLRSKVAAFVEIHKKAQALQHEGEVLESQNAELARVLARRQQAQKEVEKLNRCLEERLTELEGVNREMETLYELKTQFFANVSHELRTPLALMRGVLEKLLAEEGWTEEHRRSLEMVESNTHVLLQHVNEVLDIAKLDAGTMELAYAETDLARLVQLTASPFEELARERQISYAVGTPPLAPGEFDPEKLQRILLNLLSNAFQHVANGGEVRCELQVQEPRAVIAIQNSGPGMPPEMRELLFESPGLTERFSGSGLRLFVARKFVQLHGGGITVNDAPEGGTVVTVELPLRAPEGEKVAARAADLTAAKAIARQMAAELRLDREVRAQTGHRRADLDDLSADQRPLVLVVEDNPVMNQLLAETLAENYRVERAKDGMEGLEKAVALHPDLILTDVMMPRMSGDQLVRRIRDLPELDGVPVVMLTAKADQEFRTALLRDGAHDYLTKPFSMAEMLARVQNLIEMKRAREVLQKELKSQSQNVEHMAIELACRKRSEENLRAAADAANSLKDDFLATVSHELRTPLTSILGYARLLRGGRMDPASSAQAIETIERNAKSQAQIINDLLDVSRIVSGKLRLDIRSVGLRSVIQAALDSLSPAAEAKRIEVKVILDSDGVSLKGDSQRLQQIIWNLVSNAIRFTPEGGGVEVRAARQGASVEIAVTDTGVGIGSEFLPHVFERFRQADASSTRSHGGLGLGLAIVRHLTELHGGTVVAESPGEGQGATFRVTIPARLSSGSADSIPDSQAAEEARLPGMYGLRLLVVDDEPDTRQFLRLTFEMRGAAVTAVTSAGEALQEIERHRPDVIIADIGMPGEDGFDFIRRVRALDPSRGGMIPAVALTAYAGAEHRIRALSAGYQTHLPKPVEPAELAAVVLSLWGQAAEPEAHLESTA